MSEKSGEAAIAETVHRRAAKGGLIGGVSFAVNLGLNVVQVPLLLRFWPQETYGLWLSVGALATLLTTLDGGHQLYIGNLLNRSYVEDREQFRITLASAVQVTALTSAAQVVLALVFCFSGLASRWLDIALSDSASYALAVVIYTAGWIATGSIGSVLVRLFPPTGHVVRSTYWAIAMRVVQFAAVCLAACLGWGIVGTSMSFVAATTLWAILLFLDLGRLYPEYTPWWRGGSLRIGLRNFVRSGVVSIVAILDLVSLKA
ncbi:MAG: hypothetical protein IPL39_10920 [Opitutaceae bacterium]|nr:hypothetical protein [Opitutaceae bacterium]